MIAHSENQLISIVIPVYNSESTIGSLVDQLVNDIDAFSLEIVLVNDGSSDNSEESCVKAFQTHQSIVKFYSLAKNVGEHNAVMAGLNQTTGDYVVIMDDDLQNSISDVINLITFARSNSFDVVYTFSNHKQYSLLRNLGSAFNGWVASIMLKKPKGLYLSSFKILNQFLVKQIIKYDLPFPYIDGLILRTTDSIGKIQVEHNERQSGKSGYSMRKLISLWSNMFTNFSILPLRISTIIGFVIAMFGFVLGAYTVVEKLLNPDLPVGYALLVTATSVFAGAQLIAVGMVGEYIGRIFLSLSKTPQYSIRKSYEDEL